MSQPPEELEGGVGAIVEEPPVNTATLGPGMG